jgi:luciferase-type oxidoreductase
MLFSENRISLGIALPLQPRIASDIRFNEQIELVKLAEKFGFQAVWVRDVPLNNGRYPDPLGHSDPFVLLSAIAVSTSSIHLVTGAIVLTLRHPLHVAKAALSLQSLSGDRFVLGVGSGDRPSEFKVFDQNYDDRKVLFREKWSVLRNALDDDEIASENGEGERTKFWLRPRTEVKVAMLAVGSASQSLEWIARNSTGWATYHRDLAIQKDRIALWHKAVSKAGGGFRSFQPP